MKSRNIFVIMLAAAAVFWPTMRTYFFQDDWVFLSHVIDKPFLSIFSYYSESIYRPVGQELFFWIGNRLFDLNSFGFHLMAMGIFLTNIYLLWRVIEELGGDHQRNNWLILFFTLNPLHFISLNWLTQINLELAVTFSLLAILFFRRWSETKDKKLLLLMAVFYLGGLLSHEISAVLPLLLWLWRGRSRELILLMGIGAAVLAGKYLINPFPLTQDYKISFDFGGLIARLRWYVLRGMGLPEGIRTFSKGIQLAALAVPVSIVLVYGLRLIPALLIFCLGLISVIGFSGHPLSAYATVALMGLVIHLSRMKIAKTQFATRVLVITAAVMVLTSDWMTGATTPQHWTTKRAEVAKQVTEQLLGMAEVTGESEIYVISGSEEINREVYFATLKGRQIQLLTGNKEIIVTFAAFGPMREGATRLRLL